MRLFRHLSEIRLFGECNRSVKNLFLCGTGRKGFEGIGFCAVLVGMGLRELVSVVLVGRGLRELVSVW